MLISRRTFAALTLGSIFAVACTDDDRRSAGPSAGPARAGPTVLDPNDWEGVLAAARGQTVNRYLWGGSESINRFVDDTYGPVLKDRFGVTLRRVPIADTVDAVNQVLAEDRAGTADGAVDMIWINGENFSTLRTAGLLFDGWTRSMPTASPSWRPG